MGGLDPVGRYQIRSILADLKSQGTTLFLSSHILSDVESVADRAAILSAGRLRRIVDLRDLPHDRRHMEVHCKHVPMALAEEFARRGLDVAQRGEAHHILVEGQRELPELLRALDESGAQILQVAPRRASLEEIFLAEVAGTRPGHSPQDPLRRPTSRTEPQAEPARADASPRVEQPHRELAFDTDEPAEVLT
jgi:ABC-2 type transport system ATP-binding protein